MCVDDLEEARAIRWQMNLPVNQAPGHRLLLNCNERLAI
jgi:hypothetical protein